VSAHSNVRCEISVSFDCTYTLYFTNTVTLRNFLTPQSKVRLKRVNGSLVVKEISAIYETRRFITMSTRACHLSPSRTRSIQSMTPSHFVKIRLYIILPSTPPSSKWSLSHRFPYTKPVCFSPHAIHATCPVYFILLFLSPSSIW
jgi:hypothetical protein